MNPSSQNPSTAAVAQLPTISLKEAKEHILKHVDAKYPPIATTAHIAGDVLVGIKVDENGRVTMAVPVSGPPMLQFAAVEAVKQYEFRPFLIDNTPSVIQTGVLVTFYLGRSTSTYKK